MNLDKYTRAFMLLVLFFSYASNTLADYFPNKEDWDISSPEAEGVSPNKIDKLMDLSF